MIKSTSLTFLLSLSMLFVLQACSSDTESETTSEDEFGITQGAVNENGKPTFDAVMEPEPDGKSDRVSSSPGLEVSIDQSETAVWDVKNQWEETDTPAAQLAGPAWGERSGLDWNEKYHKWVESMMQTASVTNSNRVTFSLTTPWGETLPAPSLECAEAAIFLRVTFASWYNLPFYLEAQDRESRIYFGHFGMRRSQGKFARTPDFRTRYQDYSDKLEEVANGGTWPSDAELVRKKIPGSFDDAQPMIGPDAHTGAYFDRVFLNKRVGHFLITTLAYFGSIHLADTRNTYNLEPEAVTAGDILVKRWQRTGIGHVLIVMRARTTGVVNNEITKEAELASSSMPRRQPVWESAGVSKGTFTTNTAGGPGYGDLGGGLKRWRIAKAVNGRYVNVVPTSSQNDWINSSNLAAIEARPAEFETLLTELSPEQKRDTYLDIINAKREHLRKYPASCSARIAREDAFQALYGVMGDEFGLSQIEVDERYRLLEDYVFAELTYAASKTCCWNSSTSEMYDIVMDYNMELQEQSNMCADVMVFKNRDDLGDGFQVFKEYAEQTGRGAQWVAWRADESCPQANVAADTEATSRGLIDYCELPSNQGGVTPMPGGSGEFSFVTTPVTVPDGTSVGVNMTTTVSEAITPTKITFRLKIDHTWRGDLKVTLIHPSGEVLVLHDREGGSADNIFAEHDLSTLTNTSAQGEWTLFVQDMVSQDVGEVREAMLILE